MKLPIQINGETVEITLTKEQIAQIEAQKKPKKFKLNYPELFWFVASDGIYRNDTTKRLLPHAESGRYRKSQEVAEQSLLRNKRANRLEALAEQLGGLKEFVFNQPNWHVVKCENSWKEYRSEFIFEPEKVYMTKECAIEISRMLNEGEFSLDGDQE